MALAIDVDGKKMIVREGGAQMCMEVLAKCVDLLMPAAEFTTAKSPKPLSADDADRQDTAVLLLNTLQVYGTD